MASNNLNGLRGTLEARLRTLSLEIGEKQFDASTDRAELQGGNDRGDLSVAESERDVEMSEADRDFDEARLIQTVLSRIDDGSYGSCSDCGEDIPAARLDAQPLALRCIGCQSRSEQRSGRRASSM